MPAAEQAGKFLLQARVHPIERVLKSRTGLAIDFAHRRFESVQGVGEILALTVEVFLALRLLLELADGGEIHLAETLDLALGLLQAGFPGFPCRFGAEPGDEIGQLEAGRRQLLGDALAPNADLLRRQARLIQCRASRLDLLIERGASRVALPQQGIELLARDACRVQLRFDLRAHRQRLLDLPGERGQGLLAIPELFDELVPTLCELLQLLVQPDDGSLQGRVRTAPRLHLDGQLPRPLLRGLHRRTRRSQLRAHPLTLVLELHALRLEGRQRIDRRFHARSSRTQLGLGAVELGAHVGQAGLQLVQPAGGVRLACFSGIMLRPAVDVLTMQPVHLALQPVAPIFVFANAPAAGIELALAVLDLGLEPAHLGAKGTQRFLPLDHPGVRFPVPRQPQPIRAQPDAVARHHRLPGSEPASHPQRIGETLRREYRAQYRVQVGAALHLGLETSGAGRGIRVRRRRARRDLAGADHGQMSAVEGSQDIGDRIEAVHAHRLEVGAEHRLHGLLPPVLHAQLLSDPRIGIERLRLEPLGDLAGNLAERRLLQRLGGDLPPQRLLPALTQRVQPARLLALLLARRRQFGEQLGQLRGRPLAGIARERRLFRESLQRNRRLRLRERAAFGLLSLALLQQTMLLAVELLDARALDLRFALARRNRTRMRVRCRLPGGERMLAALEIRRRRALLAVRGVQSRDHRGELAGKRLELTAITLNHAGELMDLSLRLLRIRALAKLQLACMLNALLDARDLGTAFAD